MAEQLPIERVLRVTVSRETQFPAIEGFVGLLVTNQTVVGEVDANNRTKIYGSTDEVLADWTAASNVYKASLVAFGVENPPLFLKVAYMNDANDPVTEMAAINAADSAWWGAAYVEDFNSVQDYLDLAAYFEARLQVQSVPNSAVETEDDADTTNVSYALKQLGVDRSCSFYHPNANTTEFPHVGALFRGIGYDFNNPNSAYTLKFKELPLTTNVELDTAAVTAVTGFIPNSGLDPQQGHLAMTYVNIAGRDMIVEGNMASGEFFDTIHFADWLGSTIQREVFEELAVEDVVPFTNPGTAQLADRVQKSMEFGVTSGMIAPDVDAAGEPIEAYTISYPRAETVPVAQRANRIAPTISAIGRLAGAVHYASVAVTVVV